MVKGEIGGRLKTIDIAGRNYECGGSIIHPKNILMKKLVEEMGLSPTDGMNYLRSQLFNTLEYGIHTFINFWIYRLSCQCCPKILETSMVSLRATALSKGLRLLNFELFFVGYKYFQALFFFRHKFVYFVYSFCQIL